MTRLSTPTAFLAILTALGLATPAYSGTDQPLSELNQLCAEAIAADKNPTADTRAAEANNASAVATPDPDVEPTDSTEDEPQTSADILCHRVSFTISRLAPGSPEHVQSIIHLGDLKARAGHYIDAAPFYARALAIVDSREPNGLLAAQTLETLADAKLHYAKFPEADEYVTRAIAIREQLGLTNAPETARTRMMHGGLLLVLGDARNAEAAYVRARDDLGKAAASDLQFRADYVEAQRRLAQMYEVQQRYELADAEYTRLLDLAEQAPPLTATITQTHQELGWITSQLGRHADAQEHFRKALEMLHANGGSPTAIAAIEQQVSLLNQRSIQTR